jgi:hypothetical protein
VDVVAVHRDVDGSGGRIGRDAMSLDGRQIQGLGDGTHGMTSPATSRDPPCVRIRMRSRAIETLAFSRPA